MNSLMKNNHWYIGDIRVTKRELLASVTIISVMLLLGVVIAGKIEASQMDKNAEYYMAAQITDSNMFQYGMDTSVGNAFVYGTLEPVDTVTFPEIGGQYIYAEKIEEHYNQHTRTVRYTDSNGKSRTKKEVYWSWDYAGSEVIHSQRVRFCGVDFDYFKIQRPESKYIKTINKSRLVRFKYYGCEAPFTGTIYTYLRDGTISDKSNFYNERDINETVNSLTSNIGIIVFWIGWIILIGIVVFGFFYLENDWLEG